jgi:hypothetical protein
MRSRTDRQRLDEHQVLRQAIRSILSEEAGPGKSMELITRLQEINSALAAAGVGLKAGLSLDRVDHGMRLEFSLKLLKPLGIDREGSRISLAQRRGRDDIWDLPDSEGWTGYVAQKAIARIPYGSIEFGPLEKSSTGACSGAWVVYLTETTFTGWGPLLYDVAIEVSTRRAGGLAPDRFSVSGAAAEVWKKYNDARPDVEKVQLDVKKSSSSYGNAQIDWGEQLTPNDASDDCTQDSAVDRKIPWAWSKSPLSRAYRKSDGAVTAALKAAGLFWQ